ncbi:integrase [Candidatus Sulfurimonas marisnigri]|uniref:Integrase n=1 Tax=Candidatus Sulfurimonas marisnigri TaxID=2740405 RepID=A0A7S7RR55_9BACT|nr:integrase [Candidatus Sulfurimonas marisnigri]QOY55170.1 integrase [Candidatus Sulfurimonas marisnigri]
MNNLRTPKTITAEQNLNTYIESSKYESIFLNSNLKFSDNIWELNIEQKAKKAKTRAIFSTFDYAKKSQQKMTDDEKETGGRQIEFIQSPYLDYAKAYFAITFSNNPTKSISNKLTALRVLEKALLEMGNNINPVNINNDVLNKAAEIIKANYNQSTAYRIGQKLEDIAKLLNKKNLVKTSIDWRNSIKRPNDTSRIGKKADEDRNKKMPSQVALDAIPEIFNKAQTPYQLMASSTIALLFCSPNRINEVFLAPFDIEVLQKQKNKNYDPSKDDESKMYKESYGLRWFPAKGAKATPKWITSLMVDTAKKTVRRLKELTKDARKVALWYEKNPDKLFLPDELEYLRDTHLLNIKMISFILYGINNTNKNLDKKRSSIHCWLRDHSVLTTMIKGKKHATYKDVEKAVLSLLPNNFPYVNTEIGLKYSQTLIIQRKYEYNHQRDVIVPTVEPFTHQFISDALGARDSKSSLFEMFGYKEKDGSPIKATSHQFRHYLNTLAQKGGASQLDIAKWSGRLDVQQNNAYDHLSADEMLLSLREAVGDEHSMIGPLANIDDLKKKVVISRDEYAILKIRTAHLTEYGVCIHDYTMTPCQLHRDCMSCTEQVCIKGDTKRNNKIRYLRDETEKLLEKAKNALEKKYYGSNKWVEHHTIVLDRLNQICKILDDPNVPEGSFIQLSNIPVTSSIEQAKRRKEEKIESIEFDEIKKLLS